MTLDLVCPNCSSQLSPLPNPNQVQCVGCGSRFAVTPPAQEQESPIDLGAEPVSSDLFDDFESQPPGTQNLAQPDSYSSSFMRQASTELDAINERDSAHTKTFWYKVGGGVGMAILIPLLLYIVIPGTGSATCFAVEWYGDLPAGSFIGRATKGQKLRVLFLEDEELVFDLTTESKAGALKGPGRGIPTSFKNPETVKIDDSDYESHSASSRESREVFDNPDGSKTIVTTKSISGSEMSHIRLDSAWEKGVIQIDGREVPFEIHWTRKQGFHKVIFDGRELDRSWFHW